MVLQHTRARSSFEQGGPEKFFEEGVWDRQKIKAEKLKNGLQEEK